MPSAESVLVLYQDQLRQFNEKYAAANSKQAEARMLQIGSVVALLALIIVPFTDKSFPRWLPILCVPAFVLATRRHSKAQAETKFQERRRLYYKRGVARLEGTWKESGPTGEDYREAHQSDGTHPYERDLNILGDGSLFQMLCAARTEFGRGGLADYLLRPVPREEALARQAAVRELKDRQPLREQLSAIGEYSFSECTPETLNEWLDSPQELRIPLIVRIVAMICPVALLTTVGLGLGGVVPWDSLKAIMLATIGVQAAIGYQLQSSVKRVLEFARVLAPEISMLREGMAVLASQQFTSPKLADILRKSDAAPASLRQLERYTHWVRERDKEQYYWLSIYLSLGTHLAFVIEGWRDKHGTQLREWLETWAEFEALNTLGGHAYEHPEDAFPELTEGSARFTAEQLGHPLLTEAACVRNDVQLNAGAAPGGHRFYLISGSNMAGKSTLLRSIGINAVLAMAGAPVRAKSMTISPCRVCGSISTADSLLEGKSRFLAEVDRIRLTITMTEQSEPVLFVIDEIFSGTNSTDRRIAAEAVVRALITKGAIGGLSTHDLALAEIAELPELHGSNVHMSSPDDTKPLEFDYLLKPGVTRQSNALAIARLAGVPV